MTRSRIFHSTFIVMLLIFGVIATGTSVLSAWTLSTSLTEEYRTKGQAIASSIASTSTELVLDRDAATLQAILDQYLDIAGTAYVFVTDRHNDIIAHTFVPTVPLQVRTLPTSEQGSLVTEVSVGDKQYIDVAHPILAGVAGQVHVGMDMETIRSLVLDAIIGQQGMLAVIFSFSMTAMYLLIRRIARPLQQLTKYAEKLSVHDFSATVDIRSNDEIGLLAATMQSMAGELSILISGLERAVENATVELQDTLAFLQSIIDNLADGLLVTTPSGSISRFNPALLELFGFTPETDIAGKNIGVVFPQDLVELTERIKTSDEFVLTADVNLAGGNTGRAVVTPIFKRGSSFRKFTGAVVLIRDVTAEKEIDRMKTDFISTVSHELRTPLTSVLGFAKIIRKKLDMVLFPALDVSDTKTKRAKRQVSENIGIIITEGERLTELINDVLDIAKMEAGKVEWRMQNASMADLVRHAASGMRPLIEEKGLVYRQFFDQDLPLVRMDRDRIIQVLVNLLSNAIKFTPSGSISLTVVREAKGVRVSVADTGEGISDKEVSRVFDRFKQAGDTLTEKPKGTGLGLPICKHIIESHGGQIWVDSTPGEGSTFRFTLPASPQENSGDDFDTESLRKELAADDLSVDFRAPMRPADMPRIMVVDDDQNIRLWLREVLVSNGFQVQLAEDGYVALDAVREFQPHLVIMDLMMPGMDGGTTISKLRQIKATALTPILVLTALNIRHTPGANASLTKPVEEASLIETIHSLLGGDQLPGMPCLVITPDGRKIHDDLLMVCPGEITFLTADQVQKHLQQGFEGTLFIPASLSRAMDLQALCKENLQIVILP